MDLNEAAMELHRQAIELSLTCPFSRDIYSDPVLIQQSGHVVDRKSLRKWLLKNPTRCPVTNVDFGEKLQYCDCHFSKSHLIQVKGVNEYKRYDDSEFQRQYEALQIVPRESKEKKLGARESKSVDHFDQDSRVDPLCPLPICRGDGPEEALRLGDGNLYSVDTFTCLDENPASLSDEDLKKIPLDFHGDPFTTLSTEINSPNSSSRPPNVSYQRENLIIQKPKVNDSRAIYDTQDKWHVSESMDAKDGGMISSSSAGVAIEEKPSSEPSDNETTASFMEYIESLGNHGNGTNGSVDPFLRFSEDEDDLVDIDQVDITNEDIYCGKENKDSPHPGNIEFRRLIGDYKVTYQGFGSQHGKKTKLRNYIVDRKLFGGRSRFIVKRGNDTFYLQTETKVRKKVSQALREKSNSDKKKQSCGLKAVPGKSNRFGILHDDEVRDYVSRRLQDHAEETKKKRKEREEKKKNEEQERMEETKEEQDSDNFDNVSEGIAAIPAWITFGEGEEGDDHETSLKQNKKQKRS